jgi:hypothetical protein
MGALDQRVRVAKLLDLLPAIRKRNDEFVIVTVGVTADLIEQLGVLTLEKPNHRTFYQPYRVAVSGI